MEVTTPAPLPVTEPPSANLTTLVQLGCRQYHAFYPMPWSADEVPEGFGPDGTDPSGTVTTLYQHVSFCAMPDPEAPNGTVEVAEVWSAISVAPPAELASEDAVLHLVLLDLSTSSPALLRAYEAWGFGGVVREAEITWVESAAGLGRIGEVECTGGGSTYTLHAQVGPPLEGSVAGLDRVFAIRDGTVTGWFDYVWPGWTDVGLGTVVFTAQGGDAPPVYPGQVHQVADTDVTVTYVPFPVTA